MASERLRATTRAEAVSHWNAAIERWSERWVFNTLVNYPQKIKCETTTPFTTSSDVTKPKLQFLTRDSRHIRNDSLNGRKSWRAEAQLLRRGKLPVPLALIRVIGDSMCVNPSNEPNLAGTMYCFCPSLSFVFCWQWCMQCCSTAQCYTSMISCICLYMCTISRHKKGIWKKSFCST